MTRREARAQGERTHVAPLDPQADAARRGTRHDMPLGFGPRRVHDHRVRLVRLRGPRLPRGVHREARLLARLRLLRRRGGGLPEAARRLQVGSGAPLLAVGAALARGWAAGADRPRQDHELGQAEPAAARSAGLRRTRASPGGCRSSGATPASPTAPTRSRPRTCSRSRCSPTRSTRARSRSATASTTPTPWRRWRSGSRTGRR